MSTQIHHSAAAGLLEIIPIIRQPVSDSTVVGIAGTKNGDLSQLSLVDQVFNVNVASPGPLRERNHKLNACFVDLFRDLVAVGNIQSHDFLGKDMLAGPRRLDHNFRMHSRRSSDGYSVNILSGQQDVQIRFKINAQFLRPYAAPFGIFIPYAGNFGVIHTHEFMSVAV